MRSINARFIKYKYKNPYLSDLTNFALAISGQNFTRKRIHETFNKLVDRDDHNHLEAWEKKELMTWLESL